MLDITREQLEKLYNKQQFMIKAIVVYCCVTLVLYVVMRIAHIYALPVLLLSFILLIIITAAVRKKLIPAGHTSELVKEAYSSLQYDYYSDGALNMLFTKLGRAQNFPEKTYLTLFAAEIYMIRGEADKAIAMLGNVDRSEFVKYPTVGMSFYDDILSMYCQLGDYDSVMRAYRDGEPFIRECADRNYVLCNTAIEILIRAYTASGDPHHALELRLMKNDFQNRFKKSTSQMANQTTTPFKQFLDGIVFLDTAELYYMCGDKESAARAVDTAGPLVAKSPYYLDRANRLSAAIRGE